MMAADGFRCIWRSLEWPMKSGYFERGERGDGAGVYGKCVGAAGFGSERSAKVERFGEAQRGFLDEGECVADGSREIGRAGTAEFGVDGVQLLDEVTHGFAGWEAAGVGAEVGAATEGSAVVDLAFARMGVEEGAGAISGLKDGFAA